MGDANPIRTLGDYSKPSHEGYMMTIELPEGNNVVPLRSDTIWLVQNGYSFHGLWSEDPNQNLKDFFKLVDLLDLNCDNRERTRLHLFQFSLRDQASNWLELQRLMEAHLALMQPSQVNKITSSCEICGGPHDTQYCMENPEEAFSEYASSRIDEARGKWYTFKPEQNNLGDTYNPSWKSHPNLSRSSMLISPLPSINAVRTCSKEASHSQTSQPQTRMRIGTPQIEELEPTLEDELQDLHLNLPVLEVLAHSPIYKAMLDKYVESLELGKNGSSFVQVKYLKKWKAPSYSLYHVGPRTPLLVGRGFLATANIVTNCRKAKIAVGERIASRFYAVFSTDITNKTACRKFLIKNEEEIFTMREDGVGIKPDDVASPAM
nr:zinc finger, CCHC-type [Tanacetum cinerariifolium]